MSLSKSKCLYSNHCLHFLKRAVPLNMCGSFKTFSNVFLRLKVQRRRVARRQKRRLIEPIDECDQIVDGV